MSNPDSLVTDVKAQVKDAIEDALFSPCDHHDNFVACTVRVERATGAVLDVIADMLRRVADGEGLGRQ